MKSFISCLATLTALVTLQARKMHSGHLIRSSSKALGTSGSKLPLNATVEDMLADVPGKLHPGTPPEDLAEDNLSQIANQSTVGLNLHHEKAINPSDAAESTDAMQATLAAATLSDVAAQSAGGLKESDVATQSTEPKDALRSTLPEATLSEQDAIQGTLSEATLSDVAAQSAGGLKVQHEESDVATQSAGALKVQHEESVTQTGDATLPVVEEDDSKLPPNIDSIEKQVLFLASTAAKAGKADDAMLQMVDSINGIINMTLLAELNEQSDALITSVDHLRNNTLTCYAATLNKAANATPDLFNLSLHSRQHRACRAAQIALKERASRLRILAAAYAEQKALWCGKYNESETGYVLNARAQCLVDQGVYHGTLWLSQFYQDQSAFWLNLYNIAVAARLKCENATAIWQEAEANAAAADVAAANKAAECNEIQKLMDGASCSYKAYIDGLWAFDEPDSCNLVSQEVAFIEAHAHAVTETYHLNVQLKGIWRIQCYLHAFTEVDIDSHIKYCQHKVYQNGTTLYDNTTGLFYPYPCDWSCNSKDADVISSQPQPEVPHECEGRYSNMTDIAGTPDYENAHYFPYKALVFECNSTCCPNACR